MGDGGPSSFKGSPSICETGRGGVSGASTFGSVSSGGASSAGGSGSPGAVSSEGVSSVGSTLCGVLISEAWNLFGASASGVLLKLGSLILGSLIFGSLTFGRFNLETFQFSPIFFRAEGIPAASGTPSNPRYARSWDDVGLALETTVEGCACWVGEAEDVGAGAVLS